MSIEDILTGENEHLVKLNLIIYRQNPKSNVILKNLPEIIQFLSPGKLSPTPSVGHGPPDNFPYVFDNFRGEGGGGENSRGR